MLIGLWGSLSQMHYTQQLSSKTCSEDMARERSRLLFHLPLQLSVDPSTWANLSVQESDKSTKFTRLTCTCHFYCTRRNNKSKTSWINQYTVYLQNVLLLLKRQSLRAGVYTSVARIRVAESQARLRPVTCRPGQAWKVDLPGPDN